jgi:hypothetical protein
MQRSVSLLACLFSAIVVLLALMLAGLRSGLELPVRQIVLCGLLFGAGAFAGFLVFGARREPDGTAVALFPLLTLLVWASPLAVFLIGVPLEYLYAVLLAAGIARAWPAIAALRRAEWLFIAIVAPLAAFYLFLRINNHLAGGNALSPEFAATGLLARDAKLHAAVTYMIQNYGVASLGMDGLVPLRYHVGSHWWFAAIGKVTGDVPAVSYVSGSHLLMIPGVWFAPCLAALCLTRNESPPLRTLAVTLGAIVLMDAMFGGSWFGTSSWWISYYISESCTFAFLALGLALPILFACSGLLGVQSAAARTAFWVAGVLAIFVLTSLKSSVGVLWALALAFLALRSLPPIPRLAVWLAIAAMAWIAARFFIPGVGEYLGHSRRVVPLYFLRMWPDGLSFASFLAALLLPAGLLWTTARHFSGGWKRSLANPDPAALYAQTVGLVAFAGAMPALLGIPQDSAVWYFLNVAHWFALPAVVALLCREPVIPFREAVRASDGARFVAAVVLLAALANLWNLLTPSALGKHYADKARALDSAAAPRVLEDAGAMRYARQTFRKQFTLVGPELRAKLDRTVGARATGQVRAMIRQLGGIHQAAVFFPPRNHAWWSFVTDCLHVYHAQPALTGIPSLMGAPPESMRCGKDAYQEAYGPESVAREIGDAELCTHARRRSVRHVLIVNDIDAASKNRILHCDG